MRRLTAVLCSFALLACGSEPTSLDGGSTGVVQSVEVIEGDGQTVPVEGDTDTVRVVVRDSSDNPISGETVNYEVDGPFDCGNWETGSLPTDQNGRAGNVIHIGTVASTRTDVDCTFRVVHARPGAPAPLVDSVEVEVLPGALRSWFWQPGNAISAPPDTVVDARPWLAEASDVHGNPIDVDSVISTTSPEWRFENRITGGSDCGSGDGSGPTGSGWDVTVPDFVAEGYTIRGTRVMRDGETFFKWEAAARLLIVNDSIEATGIDPTFDQFVAETREDTLPEVCTA